MKAKKLTRSQEHERCIAQYDVDERRPFVAFPCEAGDYVTVEWVEDRIVVRHLRKERES